MRQMRDLLVGEPALGEVFQRRHPSAVRQRLVLDLDRTAGRRGQDPLKGPSLRHLAQDGLDVFVDVVREGPGFLAMPQQFVKACSPA